MEERKGGGGGDREREGEKGGGREGPPENTMEGRAPSVAAAGRKDHRHQQ